MSNPTAQSTSETAKIGDTYTRNRFEVHYLGDDGKSWFALARNAKTLAEARKQLEQKRQDERMLASFIQSGAPSRMRIVKVEAVCTVVS